MAASWRRLGAAPDYLKSLDGWRRGLAALVFGAAAASSMAPLGYWPALFLAFTGLIWLLAGCRSAVAGMIAGYLFTYAYLVASLFWIASAFFVDAARFAWLSPLPVLGLPAFLAIFTALAVGIMMRFRLSGWSLILGLALAWSVGEFARGRLFTGFPWNAVGYAWSDVPAMMQAVSIVGVDGLGLATVILAAAPAIVGLGTGQRARIGGLLVVAAIAGGTVVAGQWRLSATSEAWPDVKIRLVQGNIPQTEKFKGRRRADHLRHYVALSAGPGVEQITHFVWPETAVEFFLSSESSVQSFLAKLASRGADGAASVLAGAPRQAMSAGGRRIFNSYHAVDAQGRVTATYDKHHLVPFGEYLPWRGVLQRIGLDKLAHGAIDYQAGTGQSALTLAGLPPVRVLVCYEVIFPNEIVASGAPRPGWLLNVTNDAWFGEISGPYQHFAIARFRAVEQGLPLVRAANTGISGLVDPFGRTVATIGLGQQGILDLALPKPLPPTIYARWGDGAVFAVWLVAFGLILAVAIPGRIRA